MYKTTLTFLLIIFSIGEVLSRRLKRDIRSGSYDMIVWDWFKLGRSVSGSELFFIVAFCTGLACSTKAGIEMEVLTREIGNEVTLGTIGSVVDVIEGRVDIPLKFVDISGTIAGFEAGSPYGESSIGEMVSFNGIVFSRSTDLTSDKYNQLIVGNKLVSNGAAFIRKGEKPSIVVRISSPCSLLDVYSSIYEDLKEPFVVVGVADFSRTLVTAITCPPINNENIFDNHEKYYGDGNYEVRNGRMAIVGCAADLSNVKNNSQLLALQSVLYDNPSDENRRLTAHTHGLLLRLPIQDVNEIKKDSGENVYHIFHSSTISFGEFQVYKVRGAQRL